MAEEPALDRAGFVARFAVAELFRGFAAAGLRAGFADFGLRAGFTALARFAAARRLRPARAGFSSLSRNPYCCPAAIASATVGDSPGNGIGFGASFTIGILHGVSMPV